MASNIGEKGKDPAESPSSNPGESMDTTPVPTLNPSAVAATAELNPSASHGWPSAPTAPLNPPSNPFASGDIRPPGADPSAGTSQSSDWSAEMDAADADFTPVLGKDAKRKARDARLLAQRQAQYPKLYAAGMSDPEVRAMLDSMRQGVYGPSAARVVQHKTPAGHQLDSRKRALQTASPTGFTPQPKQPCPAVPLEGQAAPTFAEVTSRQHDRNKGKTAQAKPKEPVPYMLEVHSGVDSRSPVAEDVFPKFRRLLMTEVFTNLRKPKEQKIALNISFTQWSPTKRAILIACKDDTSQAWCRAQVDGITLEDGTRFRAWDPVVTRYRAVRVTVGDLDITPNEALELVRGCNDDLYGEIVLLKRQLVPSRRGGQQVLLGFDDLAAASLYLKKEPLRVSLGLNSRQAPYPGLSGLITRLYNDGHRATAGQLVQLSRDPTVVASFEEAEGGESGDEEDEEGEEAPGSDDPAITPVL
jgi:hypothetical protein